MADDPHWWAKGTLLENCNCRLICRCHIDYRQPADHERCLGFLAAQIESGRYGDTVLDGFSAVLLTDSPQVMLEPGWTVGLCVDERADAAQRLALEAIFGGQAGSGWAVLAALGTRRLETRYLPIRLERQGRNWTLRVGGLLESVLEASKGKDKTGAIRLENIFNQIHGSVQDLAWGSSRYGEPYLHFSTERTHALSSSFSWRGP